MTYTHIWSTLQWNTNHTTYITRFPNTKTHLFSLSHLWTQIIFFDLNGKKNLLKIPNCILNFSFELNGNKLFGTQKRNGLSCIERHTVLQRNQCDWSFCFVLLKFKCFCAFKVAALLVFICLVFIIGFISLNLAMVWWCWVDYELILSLRNLTHIFYL